MDWNAPDIKNTFEYELVDPFDLSMSLGYLEGVVGCKITESYRGDYRSSASLEVDGADLPAEALVRVWHTAELGGEVYRHMLGTFMQQLDPDLTREYGRMKGTIPLQSTLLRLGTDKRAGYRAVPRHTAVVPYFESIVANAGGTAIVSALDRSKTFSKDRAWTAGESVLTEAHRCADAINGYISVDAMGRVTMEPYQLPSKRAVSHVFPSGSASPVLLGVKRSAPEVVNTVVAYYKSSDRTYSVKKEVAETHPWHWRRIGRHATKEYSESSLEELLGWELDGDTEPTDAQIYAALAAKAASRLAECSQALNVWGATLIYAPVSCGEVVELPYSDSPDGAELTIRGMVTQREITCDASMLMQVTIEEV